MGNFLLYMALALVATVLQTTVLAYWGVGGVRIELYLIILTYVALNHSLLPGSFLALGLGFLYDLHSAAPRGLHGLTFLICFLVLNLTRSRLYIHGEAFCIGLVAAMVVFHEIVLYWILVSRGVMTGPGWREIAMVVPKALLSGALWSVFRPIMAWMDRVSPAPYVQRVKPGRLEFR